MALFGLWSYAMLRAGVLDGRAWSCAAPVVWVLAYSQTEVIWNPFAVDGLSWIFLMLTGLGLVALPARDSTTRATASEVSVHSSAAGAARATAARGARC
jgi:hypothetical protein